MNKFCHATTAVEGVRSSMVRALTAARVREALAGKALDADQDNDSLYLAWNEARKHLNATEEAARTCPF